MRHSNWLSLACIPLIAAVSLTAQQPKTYRARLSPVPLDVSMQATVAGTGSVSAVLTGTRLAVTGTFDGIKSPATIAQIHKSPIRGVRFVVGCATATQESDDETQQRTTRALRP